MKVLHVFNELMPSGGEVMIRIAAPLWQKEGLDLSILSVGEVIGPYADELKTAGFKIYHIPFSKTFKFLEKVWRFLKNNEFDIVHIHTERGNFYYAILCKLAGISGIVRTIHSYFPFRGLMRIQRIIQRFVLRICGVLHISISPIVYKTEKSKFFNRTIQINNWYDKEKFYIPSLNQKMKTREELGINPKKYVIVSVGNCSQIKNHNVIIETVANIQDEDLLYLHIGVEDESGSERELAKRLHVDGQIRFLGYQKDIRPFLWAADLFVMPSLREGVGNAAIEAMATGLPCILSNVEGLRDLNSASENLALVEPKPEPFEQEIIRRMQAHDDEWILKPHPGLEKWDIVNNAMEYYQVYKKLKNS